MKGKHEHGTAAIKEEEVDEEKDRKMKRGENSAKLNSDPFHY